MKYILSFLTFICILSCNSNIAVNSSLVDSYYADSGVSDSLVKVTSESEVIELDNLKITLPGGWQKVYSSKPEVILIARSENNYQKFLFLVKEKYHGIHETYALDVLRGFKKTGATLIASKYIDYYDLPLIAVEISDGALKTWAWVAVKSGFGYTFVCSGLNPVNGKELCESIAKTLRIK